MYDASNDGPECEYVQIRELFKTARTAGLVGLNGVTVDHETFEKVKAQAELCMDYKMPEGSNSFRMLTCNGVARVTRE